MNTTQTLTEQNWDPADKVVQQLESLRYGSRRFTDEVIRRSMPKLDPAFHEMRGQIRELVRDEAYTVALQVRDEYVRLLRAAKALGVTGIHTVDEITGEANEEPLEDENGPFLTDLPERCAEYLMNTVAGSMICDCLVYPDTVTAIVGREVSSRRDW